MWPLLCAVVCAPLFGGPASAHPDGGLRPYVDHEQEVVLVWPADGSLTDGYGPRWGRMHRGIDIGMLRSLPVVAAASGTVTETGFLNGYAGYGTVVLVDLGDGYTTLYAHLSRVGVRAGERVTAGTRLGLAGCTGSCTGTHLHFELHRDGQAVDPAPFIVR